MSAVYVSGNVNGQKQLKTFDVGAKHGLSMLTTHQEVEARAEARLIGPHKITDTCGVKKPVRIMGAETTSQAGY